MSSIPSINNTPTTPDIPPETPAQAKADGKRGDGGTLAPGTLAPGTLAPGTLAPGTLAPDAALQKKLGKEAAARAEAALAALDEAAQGAASAKNKDKGGDGAEQARRNSLNLILAEVEANPENIVFSP